MKKVFPLFLVLLFALSIFGQNKSSVGLKGKSEIQTTKDGIPKGWKLVDLDSFSFILPESMEDKKVRGIDSQVWEFQDDEMELAIDSGRYTNDFQDLKSSYKVEQEEVIIDGKSVNFFKWDKNKDISDAYMLNKDGSIVPHTISKKHFSIGVYFQRGERRYTGTNFIISTRTLEEQEIAKKILYSIKFKQK